MPTAGFHGEGWPASHSVVTLSGPPTWPTAKCPVSLPSITAGMTPEITFSNVLFPDAFGPVSQVSSPGAARNVISVRTWPFDPR